MMKAVQTENLSCACGSGVAYLSCCGPYIENTHKPDQPDKLMRSRYVAYTQANMQYIEQTMCGKALDQFDSNHNKQWTESVQWMKLDVINSAISKTNDRKGFVEFKAYYKTNGLVKCMHEKSSFIRIDDTWFYNGSEMLRVTDSSVHKVVKPGRNDPCFCGSHKKYKKCCYHLKAES